MLKKFLAEMIGTFILVLVGTGAVIAAAYSVGPISGAHINPAVSLAMFINKHLT